MERKRRRRYPLIDRLDAADPERITHEYLAAGRPVVVHTAASRTHWEPAALRASFGHHVVDAEETALVFVEDRARRRVPIAQLIDGVLAGDTNVRWKGLDFARAVPGMKEQLATSPPASDAILPRGTSSVRRALWLAPKSTMSSLHHDGNSDNFNWQIYGRKLFLLVPPSGHAEVYAYGSAESPLNPFHPALERFPRFACAAAVEATLEPGDVLLIPKYWWHCVYSVEPSVNLNTWFSYPGERSPWRALSGAPLFHRGCASLAAEMKRRKLVRMAKLSRTLWHSAYARLTQRPAPEERGELFDP